MPKPGDNLSTLLRSLGPDSATFQSSANAAVQDAEKRWPLLKALPPRRQDAPPPLSVDERQRWSRPDAAPSEPRKPALSLPSMSSKLAQSLSKMAGPRLPQMAAPEPAPRVECATPAEARSDEPTVAPAAFFAALEHAAIDSVRAADEPSAPELFKIGAQQAAEAEPEPPAGADDSLAGLFRRLETPQERVAKSPARRPSFLDRWTKR